MRAASVAEAGRVVEVLSSANGCLEQRGERLWSDSEIALATVGPQVSAGNYFVATKAGAVVAVFRYQLEDPYFWPEIPEGSSAFVHKMAVLPAHQGEGIAHMLLEYACSLARDNNRRHLRLDCISGRPRLRAVYEAFGFRHHSDRLIGNTSFHRFEFDLERR